MSGKEGILFWVILFTLLPLALAATTAVAVAFSEYAGPVAGAVSVLAVGWTTGFYAPLLAYRWSKHIGKRTE